MSQKDKMEFIVNNQQQIQEVSQVILTILDKVNAEPSTLALSGDLGSGKTTFTKSLATQLGIIEPVTSPTFVIQKTYNIKNHKTFNKLIHIDAYRLDKAKDTKVLNLEDTLNTKGNLIVIEWADNIKEALPKNTINIKFEYIDDSTRRVIINATI